MKRVNILIVTLLLLASPFTARAEYQPIDTILTPLTADGVLDTLAETVQRALVTNPDVLASYQEFLAATREQDAARGKYLPSIDLTARAGHAVYRDNGIDNSFKPWEGKIELTQMLYDGFETRNEVARLEAEKLVSFYQLLAEMEGVSLEVVNAYLDVLRYRSLLAYADENLRHHESIYQQVEDRVSSGISRGVDLDQAKGRLALARANRRTESSNLHDVSSRFLRLVGELPGYALEPPSQLLSTVIPSDTETALQVAFVDNPAVSAAFERATAAHSAMLVRKALYQPRLDFKAHHSFGEDRDRISGDSSETVVELVATFNLYRGASDKARISQFLHLYNRAVDLRDKICRNVRQELTIALRDIDFLDQQLAYLKQHQESSAKTREIYRDQFEIGQRTLLDLLDTENEYFDARRAYTMASYDYVLAYARSAANMGQLMNILGLLSEEDAAVTLLGGLPERNVSDQFCPAQGIPDAIFLNGEVQPQPWLK
ncbi:MAG: channel protein TolC [Desulfuromonas sp.]|nr:MAG: channel protein TolC [Desulfuromonas sp.]